MVMGITIFFGLLALVSNILNTSEFTTGLAKCCLKRKTFGTDGTEFIPGNLNRQALIRGCYLQQILMAQNFLRKVLWYWSGNVFDNFAGKAEVNFGFKSAKIINITRIISLLIFNFNNLVC